jgi:hypothetical protein
MIELISIPSCTSPPALAWQQAGEKAATPHALSPRHLLALLFQFQVASFIFPFSPLPLLLSSSECFRRHHDDRTRDRIKAFS